MSAEEILRNNLPENIKADAISELSSQYKFVIKCMQDFSAQQTKELSELLPDSFYANTPLKRRIKMMVDIWNRSVQVAQELQEENERLKESLNKIDNLIGNYMHNDSAK